MSLPPAQAAASFRRRHPDLVLPPVVVVVPAFNEAGAVGPVVASVPAQLGGLDAATLVVDDGSSDSTAEEARAAGALVCSLPVNCGQGTALRLGYDVAIEHGARYLATLDADGQWSAADLDPMAARVTSGGADIVSGTRRTPSPRRDRHRAHPPGGPGAHPHDTDDQALRRSGVVLFAAVIRLLTGARVTDPANGLRVMTSEVAQGVQLDQAQFQSTELLISALSRGFRYEEVPVGHAPRQVGVSKKGRSMGYALRFSRALFGTYIRERGWRRRTRP
ncbi:MAG: glycosyltransferase family 2 protein [Acidimicrobiales bacterium]